MFRLAVLISGRGSNLQALINAAAGRGFPAQIVKVISNKPGVEGLKRAATAHIPSSVISHRDYSTRQEFESELDRQLQELGVDLVCLAGFMRILTPWFVNRWQDKLINIHPSLLPAFPGMDTHERALSAGVKFTGCTVHYVRPDVDSGPIIVQAVVPVLQDDDPETLAARVLKAEHQAYPYAVRLIAEDRIKVVDDKIVIEGLRSWENIIMNPDDRQLFNPKK